jgi:Ran GTPase-activating protein (RanGAP) involved in mRNA processing and transport
MGAINLAT